MMTEQVKIEVPEEVKQKISSAVTPEIDWEATLPNPNRCKEGGDSQS
jgi:hypothetical protein